MTDPFDSNPLGAELGELRLELERIDDLADGVGRALARAFRDAVQDGRGLERLLRDIARSFSEIALRAAFKPLGDLAGNLVGGLFAATNPALHGAKPFAKGGVLAAPAYFPLGGGFGVAGEAGPEAVLPLQRGSDGRLGVAAAGGAPTVNITFNVNAGDARSFRQSEAEITALLLRAAKRGTRGS